MTAQLDATRAVGASFPPRNALDIHAYDDGELVAGFTEYRRDDPEPGPNRSPAYRWGWANRKRDAQREDDGFDTVRREYFERFMRSPESEYGEGRT